MRTPAFRMKPHKTEHEKEHDMDDRKTQATVLVVDDEASIRESLRMILEFEGYRVDEATSGSAALTRVAEGAPDAVVLDVKMPGMDGLDTLTAFRERGYAMRVLMIGGHGGVDTAVEATRRGAVDLVEKPLHRDRARPRHGTAASQRHRKPRDG